jgi:Txe/YoeB family toxin of toxin-antitoxin system
VSWRLVFTTHARRDARKLAASGLKPKAAAVLDVVRADPFGTPPPFEKLLGKLADSYSRRIDVEHRIVYQVLPEAHTVKVLRMWTHYE